MQDWDNSSVFFTEESLKRVKKTWKEAKMEEQMGRVYWKMLADWLEIEWSTKDSTDRIIKKVKDFLDSLE
jgi:hypothetical protein